MEVGWLKNLASKVLSTFLRNPRKMDQSRWVTLPDIVIVDIYKYLGDRDRLHMALCCKSWAILFHSPCLWRHRSFDMGGYRAFTNGTKACQFADSLGPYLRYLTITCNHPSYHTAKVFQKAMEDLLVKIRPAKILEFEMERLELDRFWKYETARDKLVTNLVRFFKSQRCLRMFDMTGSQFPALGGCRIMESLGSSSGDKIQEIYMEDFFHSRIAAFQLPRFVATLPLFTNLECVALNYNCISDQILEGFSSTLNGKLRSLNIKVYRNDPHVHHISPTVWRAFRKACPRLQVTVWFESIGFYEEILPILSKEMPLRDFHMWTGYDDETAEWRLGDTIQHLMDTYSSTLMSLSLEMDNNHELVDDVLLRLLQQCKQLRHLTLNAIIMVTTVQEICMLIMEKKINLQSFNLTACGLSESEWTELTIIKELYTPMAEERGLNITFSTDLLIDIS